MNSPTIWEGSTNPSNSSNSSLRLSPWWDAVTQPPVHLGWYQVDWIGRGDNGVNDYWLWDGEHWYMPTHEDLLRADKPRRGDKWRGVIYDTVETRPRR